MHIEIERMYMLGLSENELEMIQHDLQLLDRYQQDQGVTPRLTGASRELIALYEGRER